MAESIEELRPRLAELLNKELYVLITRPAVSPEILANLEAHLDSQVRLEKDGCLFGAGPLMQEGGDQPVAGMFILRAESYEDARRIADSDPLHAAGLRTYELYKWVMNEGRITLRFDYSDQSVRFE